MPGGNQTGPVGEGPMTGRGAGYCSGADYAPGEKGFRLRWGDFGSGRVGRVFGNGYRRGDRLRLRERGRQLSGRGWRQRGPGVNSSSDSSFHSELEWLREQKRNIELTLDDVNHRIGEVEDKDSNSSSDQH